MSLEAYFLDCPSQVALIECYEISHPAFTKTYYLCKNDARGGVFTHEGGAQIAYEYAPIITTRIGTSETLDSAIDISIGDHGDIIAAEIAAVRKSGRMNEKPTVTYRGYRSDDYSQPLEGPFSLTISDTTRQHAGAAFKAHPKTLDANRTGRRYLIEIIPMLAGFVR